MAGLRVEFPTGEGWSYSLNATNYQDSPVFSTQLGGVPFAEGITYLVYCLHVTGFRYVDRIVYGEPTNEDNLQRVTERGGKTNVLLELLGGLVLGNVDITDQDYPVLVRNPVTGRIMQRGGTVTLPPELTVATVGDLYTLVELVWMMRFDVNDCAEFRGWAFDPLNPTSSPTVVIKRNGQVVETQVCAIDRIDVRDELIRQGKLPVGTTFAKYGWVYYKPDEDHDGLQKTYQAFNPQGTVEAISTVGALNTVTCQAPDNPVPTVANPAPDQTITEAGDQYYDLPAAQFSDPGDTQTLIARKYVEGTGTMALPAGITVDFTHVPPRVHVDESVANQSLIIRITDTDSHEQSVWDDHELTVARTTVPTDPAVDVIVTVSGGGYAADFKLRCPSDWQYRFDSFPNWNELIALSGGTDSQGYQWGIGILPLANNQTLVLHLKISNGSVIDLPVTISGTSARHTIYPTA